MKTILTTLVLVLTLSFSNMFAQEIKTDQEKAPTSIVMIGDYYNEDFKPFAKGNWFTKIAFSLSDKNLENVSRLLDEVEDGQDQSLNLSLSAGHFIKDYFMVGAKFGYQESKFVGSVINLDSDKIFVESIKRGGSIEPFVRIAMPLSKNHRLSFYNDIGVSFGYGKGLTRNTENNDEIDKEYSTQYSIAAGISPGITFFAVENFAIEAGANIIGYRFNVLESTNGEGVNSRKLEHDVNFRLNILSLNIGATYFF